MANSMYSLYEIELVKAIKSNIVENMIFSSGQSGSFEVFTNCEIGKLYVFSFLYREKDFLWVFEKLKILIWNSMLHTI